MRLVTWNVNSLRARLPRVLELLAELRPDVVCLQETKAAAPAFPSAALRAAGYTAVHHSAGRWAGVAILARADLAVDQPVAGLPGEAAPEEARWIEASVEGMRIVSKYVPNGRAVGTKAFAAKLAFLDAARRRVSALRGSPLVLAGDLNVAPTDRDVYDPQVFAELTHTTPEERSRFEGLLGCGLVDAYRLLHPEEVGYTWWDYRAGHFHRNLGMRLDFVLVGTELAAGVRACDILRAYRKGAKPSDHAPLLTTLAAAG
jgi:exodeoxyribonuclease III